MLKVNHFIDKKTCLWLIGLNPLVATNIVEAEPRIVYESGKTMPAWYADAWHLPKEERAKLRSKTFPGIAEAIAMQFTQQITQQNDYMEIANNENKRTDIRTSRLG